MEIPLENASPPKGIEEQWRSSPQTDEEPWNDDFYHAK
jgi:hypothetical protein